MADQLLYIQDSEVSLDFGFDGFAIEAPYEYVHGCGFLPRQCRSEHAAGSC